MHKRNDVPAENFPIAIQWHKTDPVLLLPSSSMAGDPTGKRLTQIQKSKGKRSRKCIFTFLAFVFKEFYNRGRVTIYHAPNQNKGRVAAIPHSKC